MPSVFSQSRISVRFPAARLKIWACVILACAAVPTSAAGKRPAGRVLDRAALQSIKTYCVDTNNLKRAPIRGDDFPHPEAFDVREVIKRESKPNGLLSRLPWKLEKSCAAPGVDAIVRIAFTEGLGVTYVWRARLQVSDKASSRLIYSVEGNPLGIHAGPPAVSQEDYDHALRQSAAYHALAALVSDIKTISKNP